MKINGFDTLQSDILFVKPVFAKDLLKPLLLLGCNDPLHAGIQNKTILLPASLHHHPKKIKQFFFFFRTRMIQKKIFCLFHIIEHAFSKSALPVKKDDRVSVLMV